MGKDVKKMGVKVALKVNLISVYLTEEGKDVKKMGVKVAQEVKLISVFPMVVVKDVLIVLIGLTVEVGGLNMMDTVLLVSRYYFLKMREVRLCIGIQKR